MKREKLMMSLFNEKERKTIRDSKLFSKTNYPWNATKCNITRRIGNISKVSKVFLNKIDNGEAEFTHEDFFKTHEEVYPGLFFSGFEYFFNQFSTKVTYFDYWKGFKKERILFAFYYIRVIDEALIGIERELKAMQILRNRHPEDHFTFANDEEDRIYFVDIMRTTKDSKTIAYQVKGNGFRYAAPAVHAYNKKGHQKLKNDRNIDTIWFIVD